MAAPQAVDSVMRAAQSHAQIEDHHTAYVPGEGWLCQQCDADFAVWLLEHFAQWGIVTHYKREGESK